MAECNSIERIQEAQYAVNKAHDLLAFIVEENEGKERVLAECAQGLLSKAGDLLDGSLAEGSAS